MKNFFLHMARNVGVSVQGPLGHVVFQSSVCFERCHPPLRPDLSQQCRVYLFVMVLILSFLSAIV